MEKAEILRGMEKREYLLLSAYFSKLRPALDEADTDFHYREIAGEAPELSEGRTREILRILSGEDIGVLEPVEDSSYPNRFERNGYDQEMADQIEEELDIFRESPKY